MTGTTETRTPARDLPVEEIMPEHLAELFGHHHPEVELAQELWYKLTPKGRGLAYSFARDGVVDLACEDLLMGAVKEGVVVPQWVIDASATINEDWGWSPNVEKACAALQARLDEHNRLHDGE